MGPVAVPRESVSHRPKAHKKRIPRCHFAAGNLLKYLFRHILGPLLDNSETEGDFNYAYSRRRELLPRRTNERGNSWPEVTERTENILSK